MSLPLDVPNSRISIFSGDFKIDFLGVAAVVVRDSVALILLGMFVSFVGIKWGERFSRFPLLCADVPFLGGRGGGQPGLLVSSVKVCRGLGEISGLL